MAKKTVKKATQAKAPGKAKLSTSAKLSPEPARKVVAEIVDDESAPIVPDQEAYEDGREIEADLEEVVNLKPAVRKIGKLGEKTVAVADPVTTYLSELRKYPLLTKEKEQELARLYFETKDPAAAQALVTANLRFVVKVAAEYSKFGARMIDLIQEGNMGLMHAVRDFNPYKGVRLITYAVWWIRGYIQEYLMKQYSLVKIGTTQNQKKLFYQLQRHKDELDALGKVADVKLLSAKLGIPEDEVLMMTQRMSGRDISLDRPLDDESGTSLLDFQRGTADGPDMELSKHEEISYLNEAIEALRPQLSDREKIILEERILNDEPLTLQEIGDKHGITREAVRQMEARLMKKIKEQFAKSQ
jgi:RNA polymerase sigma-32 factor